MDIYISDYKHEIVVTVFLLFPFRSKQKERSLIRIRKRNTYFGHPKHRIPANFVFSRPRVSPLQCVSFCYIFSVQQRRKYGSGKWNPANAE